MFKHPGIISAIGTLILLAIPLFGGYYSENDTVNFIVGTFFVLFTLMNGIYIYRTFAHKPDL